eukprot:756992-Hanusia_phi.AAC.1
MIGRQQAVIAATLVTTCLARARRYGISETAFGCKAFGEVGGIDGPNSRHASSVTALPGPTS